MFIQVKLLHYHAKFFTYSVPSELQHKIKLGRLVKVPMKQSVQPAVVCRIESGTQTYNFNVRDIDSIYDFPEDEIFFSFIHAVGEYYQIDELFLLQRLERFLIEKEVVEKSCKVEELEAQAEKNILTQEQKDVYSVISDYVKTARYQTFLLHGVTGSGKTEVYKCLIRDAIDRGKAVMFLVPEVALAMRFELLFAKVFQDIAVIGFHSASSISQKRLLWKCLLEKRAVLIIGVHMPVLLPIAHLGLIIVDEEHEQGYQEKKHPKVHSRDMSILKASMYNIPIVLGSATPSIQSLWNVEQKQWVMLNITQRFAGAFPRVEFALLKNKQKRKNFWITNELYEAIADRLSKKEQSIVFLNRRGYCFFVQCTCGFVFSCQQCSVSLTLHQDSSLLCHYCGYKTAFPKACVDCGQGSDEFLKKGVGTQQIVMILQKLFPDARIERADLDSTVKKKSWALVVEDMYDGNIDILVGTQSITKGYHFPGVTLVGILWADLNFHFPVYNALEVALQQLIQVAGRAGRQTPDSLVVVQSFDNHQVFNFVDETKYLEFYQQEIQKRVDAQYPPYKHVAEIEFKHEDVQQVELDAKEFVLALRGLIEKKKLDVTILGPVPAMIYKVKSVYSQKLFLKSFSRNNVIQLFAELKHDKKRMKSQAFFTMDPV